MALINQNVLFDRLKLYIDKKTIGLPTQFESIFIEYGLKEIVSMKDELLTVSDNIQAVIDVSAIDTEISTIVNTPGLIDAILNAEQNAITAQLEAWEAEAESMSADEYATNPVAQEVNEYISNGDGTFTPVPQSQYSALHYSVMALSSAEGLKFQGIWDISGITDPAVEPSAPTPLEDPNNPGNPLPYENGMYWIVQGDSIYDPDGDNVIDPYPTFGPAISPYKNGDQILYINNPSIPYQPWMKKRDLVNWDRVVNVPINIRTSLSYLGTSLPDNNDGTERLGRKLIGDLLIEKAGPGVMFKNTDGTDAVVKLYVNELGEYFLQKYNDNDVFESTLFKIDPDAKMLHIRNSGVRWSDYSIWHEGNMGDGSGLDADTLDGRDHTDFLEKFKIDDPDFDMLTGDQLSTIENISTPLFGAANGTLLVQKKDNMITQLFYSDNVLCTRRSGDNGSTWADWKQYGSMEFDGTRLSITLPA